MPLKNKYVLVKGDERITFYKQKEVADFLNLAQGTIHKWEARPDKHYNGFTLWVYPKLYDVYDGNKYIGTYSTADTVAKKTNYKADTIRHAVLPKRNDITLGRYTVIARYKDERLKNGNEIQSEKYRRDD